MKTSMYQVSAPRFANALTNLSAMLDKAQAPAAAIGGSEDREVVLKMRSTACNILRANAVDIGKRGYIGQP